jgi:nitrogen-specific signal transduction histidine kinase/HAMP domain-containing protein
MPRRFGSTLKMKLSFKEPTKVQFILPFLFLYLWFRCEPFFHHHLLLFFFSILGAVAILYILTKTIRGKIKFLIGAFWLMISCLLLVDFIQLATYRQFSSSHFDSQIRESSSEVKRRAEKILQMLRADSFQLESSMRKIRALTPETIPVELRKSLRNPDYIWAVYNQEGRLIAWEGEVNFQETNLPEGSDELAVVNSLHQNFFKYKRAVGIGSNPFLLVVWKPIAADYGIENQYLSRYNLLTDGLSIPPMLLYNSQSSALSPDLKIANIPIRKDFSISALYEAKQYTQFVENRVRKLHWWLELAALVFCIATMIYMIFEFLGYSATATRRSEVYFSWIVILFGGLLSAFTISVFSVFGSRSIFNPHPFTLIGFGGLFRSSGSLLFTSFFILNVVFSLLLLFRRLLPRFNVAKITNSVLLFGTFFFIALMLVGYYGFIQDVLIHSNFNLTDFSLLRMNAAKVALIFGMLWLDLSFVLFMALLLFLVTKDLPRTRSGLMEFFISELVVGLLFYAMFRSRITIPLLPTLVLVLSVEIIVLFLPRFWRSFERINLLSRFFVILLLFSFCSILFHFVRFYYARNLQMSYIEHEAAGQVREQGNHVRRVLQVSQGQLDRAIGNISLDPKISDLAYRLWTRTDLARFGYKSALEILDPSGQLVNRFALKMFSFAVNVPAAVRGPGWNTIQRPALFGNSRRNVLIGVRSLSAGGYLMVQAMEDYENLPFVRSTSPFHELFRPEIESRQFAEFLNLNVYDITWQPLFVSTPELSPGVDEARSLLRKSPHIWMEESLGGQKYQIYYFRLGRGFGSILFPAVSIRTHLVQLIDLMLFNLLWLSIFTVTLVVFFGRYLKLHFQTETSTRFSFFQKLLFAFLIFSMVPMLSLSLVIRNYVWEKRISEVTTQALNSFSVAARVVGDWLVYQAEVQDSSSKMLFSDELLEWIAQVIQQDVSLYFDRYLIATSNREFYSAGLLGQQIQGETYVDLFLKGQKYSISQMEIGSLRYLNVSGRIYRGRFKDEVITIPFLIDEKSIESEIIGLREYMMLVGASLILFAVFLGYFLARRFARPVEVLIQGTGEMSRGHLKYRIREVYQDEFQQLVESFNAMANSLDENREALERRRAYIENILNNITTAVISIDRTMNVTTINPAAAEMFQIDPRYRGSLADLLARHPHWEPLHRVLNSFLVHPKRFQKDEIAVFRTNNESNFRLVYVPLFQDREWTGAVVLIEDISDIIRSNRLSAWAEMARRVAHEVKNPLTPIQLAVEHLVKVYEDRSENFDSVLRSCSEAVLKQVKALRRLVSDFSQYGRAAVLNRSDVDLHDFLTELVHNYGAHLPEGIRMESKIPEDLPRIKIDQEKIRGALMNIIENGLQAMNGEGKITVAASRTDGFVRIDVSDTGQGVPPELLPRLFEPYFSTKTGGTGLGLSIALKNVEDHGGKIEVESMPDRGTSVRIFLPAEESARPRAKLVET